MLRRPNTREIVTFAEACDRMGADHLGFMIGDENLKFPLSADTQRVVMSVLSSRIFAFCTGSDRIEWRTIIV
jgi:hypothetical protein